MPELDENMKTTDRAVMEGNLVTEVGMIVLDVLSLYSCNFKVSSMISKSLINM